jgi:diguanylate cyclase (GGDEF)-like protein
MIEPEPVCAEIDLIGTSTVLEAVCRALLCGSGACCVRLLQPSLKEGDFRITVRVGEEAGAGKVWRRGLGPEGSLGVLEVWPAAAARGACVEPLIEALNALLCSEALEPSGDIYHERFVTETLRRLLEVGVGARSALEAAEALARTAAEVLGFPVGCAYLVDALGRISDVVTVGADGESAQRLRDCLVGREASPVWRRTVEGPHPAPDLIADTRVAGAVRPGGVAETLGFRSMAAVALLSSDGPLGLVLCGDPRPRTRWRPGDRELLSQLALQGTIIVDNARLREAERREATHDHLTGLLNRRAFRDRLADALAFAEMGERTLAVAMIDLDHLKEVNDRLGHHCGDQFLVAVSRRLSRAVRGYDILGRVGGDEFAVVLTSDGRPAQATVVANRIVEVLAAPVVVGGVRLSASASVGIACFPCHALEADTLLRMADAAMYSAKRGGFGFKLWEGDELPPLSLDSTSESDDHAAIPAPLSTVPSSDLRSPARHQPQRLLGRQENLPPRRHSDDIHTAV